MFFQTASPHGYRASEAFLGADGTTDTEGWIGVRLAFIIQFYSKIGAACTVPTGRAKFIIERRDFLNRREIHENSSGAIREIARVKEPIYLIAHDIRAYANRHDDRAEITPDTLCSFHIADAGGFEW